MQTATAYGNTVTTKTKTKPKPKIPTAAQIRKRLHTNVRAIFEEKGLKQSDVSRDSKVSEMTVSRMLRGKHEPLAHTLYAVAASVGVPMDDFFLTPEERAAKYAKKTQPAKRSKKKVA